MEWIAFIIALVLAAVGTWLDIFHTSPKFQYYGLTEANPWLRDQYKNIDVRKATIIYAAVIAGFSALFFWQWYVGVGLLITVAFKGFWHGFDNLSVMKRKRKEQIARLRELRGLLSDGQSTEWFFGSLGFEVRSGRAAYSLFRWIYIDGVSDATLATAQYDLARSIELLSQQPETEWFEE